MATPGRVAANSACAWAAFYIRAVANDHLMCANTLTVLLLLGFVMGILSVFGCGI
jgi:hypothetical protein